MEEEVIVSLTSYGTRLNNVPTVLDTIKVQTYKPAKIVLCLAYEEIIPSHVQEYITNNGIEILWTKDTKVYKKLLPTLKKYPKAIIINIDDDMLYPPTMIADFIKRHQQYRDFPISGNYICHMHLNCHCGCASLTKKEFFQNFLDYIDDEVIANCPSDDIVMTYFAAKAGSYYIRTKEYYFLNLPAFGEDNPYSKRFNNPEELSWKYLVKRFGPVPRRNISKLIFSKLIFSKLITKFHL